MPNSELNRSLSEDIRDGAILIVDDNQANVELLREMLGHAGYTSVQGETDPRTVPGHCRSRRYDLLLVDIRMPYLSGFDLMEQVREIYAGDYVPILVLTAHADQETRRKSLELGANDFLTKPFVPWELLHRVRNMLEIRTLYRRVSEQNRALENRVIDRTRALEEALSAVREADRAKLDFLSIMSHELRTPLSSIIGFAEVMKGQTMAPLGHPDYVEYVELIEESGKALLTMVNNILDYTRGATGAVELLESDISLIELLSGCVGLLLPKAMPRDVTVAIADCPRVIVRGDRRRLRELFLSLIDNAIKFNHPGGTVRLEGRVDDQGLAIAVVDDGPGIPPELASRVFIPFVQGDLALARHHEGIGLGLAMVNRIAEMHSGRVTLDTAVGKGTTVTVRLPKERVVSTS